MIIDVLLAIIGTIIVGPLAFFLLSRNSHTSRNFRKYPTGLADSVGDTVFLSIYNGAATYYLLLGAETATTAQIKISALLAILLSVTFLILRRDIYKRNDWSRPHLHAYNVGGWYHQAFFTVQSFIIVVSLIVFTEPLLLFLFAGYVVTALYDFHTQALPTLRKARYY